MTEHEIDMKKYDACCALCDNGRCRKGTELCEAEQWKQDQMKKIKRGDNG